MFLHWNMKPVSSLFEYCGSQSKQLGSTIFGKSHAIIKNHGSLGKSLVSWVLWRKLWLLNLLENSFKVVPMCCVDLSFDFQVLLKIESLIVTSWWTVTLGSLQMSGICVCKLGEMFTHFIFLLLIPLAWPPHFGGLPDLECEERSCQWIFKSAFPGTFIAYNSEGWLSLPVCFSVTGCWVLRQLVSQCTPSSL